MTTTNLLDRSVIGNDVAAAFASDTPLHRALKEDYSPIALGLLEALAVQLPERFCVEINDVPDLPMHWSVTEAFEESLLTRSDISFSDRTWTLIEQIGGARLRFGTIIALSTDPDRVHNAEFLDRELRTLPMSGRDAIWSKYLAEHSEQADRLIEWIHEADHNTIRAERSALAGLQLCWFLTTSARTVRDVATKALVVLLASRPELARSLWLRFKNLDDAYVTERLVAVIYGAAMQGRWAVDRLFAVVRDIHTDLFVRGDFPPNILTRDHARGLIQYAKSQGALPEGAAYLTNTGYKSDWPIEYVTEAQIESYTRVHRGASKYYDEITLSTVFDGDFARYQLDYAVRDWSMATKGSGSIPTAKEFAQRWFEKFCTTASQEMLAAHETLMSALATSNDAEYLEKREITDQARATFRAAVGEEAFAQWNVEASEWRQQGMYQRHGKGHDALAEFNLAWARRWVCKRAHDLGWSEELHGNFDISVKNERQTHQVERIGKKYQWIALYELCARVADNLQPLTKDSAAGDFVRLRNIDPSLLVTQTHDDGWRRFEEPTFWIPPGPAWEPVKVEQALDWLNADQEVYDGMDNISVVNPADSTQWLVLKGFESWRGGSATLDRETWRRIGCFVVRKKDLKDALALLKGKHFQGDSDLPSARSGDFRSYLGAHPWAWRANDDQAKPDSEWIEAWRPYSAMEKAVTIRPTTASYLAESTEYDASISQNINLNLPAGWLIDGLGLRLTDGVTIKYVDAGSVVRFMDPSVSMNGRSAGLIDREAFLSFLNREELVAVWALSGEKNVYGKDHDKGFGGRWTFTRVFHTNGTELVALERYQTFDEPSSSQLAALRKAEEDISEHEDD